MSRASAPDITERQAVALYVIATLDAARGFPPTYAEIGAAMRVTPGAAKQLVERLRALGLVTNDPGRVRTTVLTEAGRRAVMFVSSDTKKAGSGQREGL